MDNYLETTDRRSKRHGFFDRPAGVDFWMNVLSSGRPKKAPKVVKATLGLPFSPAPQRAIGLRAGKRTRPVT
jgi:hypothetical protein